MPIILMRHGQDEDNANGLLNGHRQMPLTALGRDQAHMGALQLKRIVDVKAIYRSPLKRTVETSEIVATELGFPLSEIQDRDGLKERCFGVLEGQPYEAILEFPNIPIRGFNVLLEGPGIEPFSPELLQRAKGELEYIKSGHNGEAILVVSHGDTIKMLMAAHYGRNWLDQLKLPYLKNCEYHILA